MMMIMMMMLLKGVESLREAFASYQPLLHGYW